MQSQVFVPFLPHLIPPLPDTAIALMLQECILSYIPAPFILCVASLSFGLRRSFDQKRKWYSAWLWRRRHIPKL